MKSFYYSQISNQAETIKRCGEFEKHDQFLLAVGKEILINAFKVYVAENDECTEKSTECAM